MSGIQKKITRHAKKQDSMVHNEENNKSIEIHLEDTEIVDKNIKTIIKTVFYMFKC